MTVFGRRLLTAATQKAGWDPRPDDDHVTKLLRSVLVSRMTLLDDADVLSEAVKRFALHTKGIEPAPADFRLSIYRAALHMGGRTEFDTLMKMYRESTLQEVRSYCSLVSCNLICNFYLAIFLKGEKSHCRRSGPPQGR